MSRSVALFVAAILAAASFAIAACGPSARPAAPPTKAVASAEPLPSPPPMEMVDPALDDIAQICKNAMTSDGDCVAPTALICDAMTTTGQACFNASLATTRCNELMDAVTAHVMKRNLGAKTAKIVSTFCEATCELRQAGHRWETARSSLDKICAPHGPRP